MAKRPLSTRRPATCSSATTSSSSGAGRTAAGKRPPSAASTACRWPTSFLDAPRGQLYVLAPNGRILRRDADLRWSQVGRATCGNAYQLTLAPWNPSRLFVTCDASYQLSFDGGASFHPPVPVIGVNGPLPPRFLFGPGDPGRIYLLRPGADLAVFGEAVPYSITAAVDAVVHPDAAEALLVSIFYPSLTLENPSMGFSTSGVPTLCRWLQLDHWSGPGSLRGLGQDPRDPDHVVMTGWDEGATRVSFDRGASWQNGGAIERAGHRPLIDPNDGNHLVVGAGGAPVSESRDGAASWQTVDGTEGSSGLLFDAASNSSTSPPRAASSSAARRPSPARTARPTSAPARTASS